MTGERVHFFGYSMGTTQMFSAMVDTYDTLAPITGKVAMMAPCTYAADYIFSAYKAGMIGIFNYLDLFEVGGPNWYLNVIKIERLFGR